VKCRETCRARVPRSCTLRRALDLQLDLNQASQQDRFDCWRAAEKFRRVRGKQAISPEPLVAYASARPHAQPTQSKTPSRQNRPNVTFYASGLWLDSATCEGGREKLVATSRRRYGIDGQIPEAALFWVLRIGAPWRDLPEAFGPYTTCHNRIQLASARPWLRHWCRWKVFTATFQYAEISAWRGHSPRQDVIFVRDCPAMLCTNKLAWPSQCANTSQSAHRTPCSSHSPHYTPQRSAAVCTGASQKRFIASSSRQTVTEQPAMSSEVTKLPTSDRATVQPAGSSRLRTASYIR